MTLKRARIYDALALLTIIVVIAFDQWTKSLVVAHLGPPENGPIVPLIGNYLTLDYIRNSGAAFGLFTNNIGLVLLIVVAVGVVAYLYLRMLNTGPLVYKLTFGLIIGGAAGNLIDRAARGGSVVDFIHFQIPQIGFSFAVFNLADASISVGIISLFLFVALAGILRKDRAAREDEIGAARSVEEKRGESHQEQRVETPSAPTVSTTTPLQPTEQDV